MTQRLRTSFNRRNVNQGSIRNGSSNDSQNRLIFPRIEREYIVEM